MEETVELLACITCGSAERETHGSTRGERLLAELQAAPQPAQVLLSSVRCLWACKRSCAVHLRAAGRPGYVLCDFEPTADVARALLEYAAKYAVSSDGSVPYREWPQAVRGHFLCRVPASAAGQASDEPLRLPPDDPNPEDGS